MFAHRIDEFPKCIRAGDIMECKKVRVDLHQNFPALIASDRNKSCIVTFSRNINYLSGFPKYTIEEINDRHDNLNVKLGRKVINWGFHPSDWLIHSTDKNEKGNNFKHNLSVQQLHAWSEGIFSRSAVGDHARSDVGLNDIFNHTITTHNGSNNDKNSKMKNNLCDVVCMVCAVITDTAGKASVHSYTSGIVIILISWNL